MKNTPKPAGEHLNATRRKHPEGWRPDDFRDLSDGTLLDIYTTKGIDPQDAAIAEHEIGRREKEGIFNDDSDSQDTGVDLIEHGYAVLNGKILYPTPSYRRWLNSDRNTQKPSGPVRESIVDRLNRDILERNKRFGARAMMAYPEDEPLRKKIPRRPADQGTDTYIRKAIERDATRRLNERRAMKNKSRYETPSSEPEEIAAAEQIANLPLYQEEERRIPESSRFKFAERDSDRLYNLFEKDFPKYAPKWATYGASTLLEQENVDPTAEELLRSGFVSRETDRIQKAIDPNGTFSAESIQAEANLKTRVLDCIISQRVKELSGDELFRAKRNGFRFAIYSGARINQKGKIIYSIPVNKGKEVYFFMRKNGIDPASEGDRFLSYNGFVGIIEAIKNNEKATKKGFKALDWYFDSFNYKKHNNELSEVLNSYRDEADRSFGAKLDEYWMHRQQQLPKPSDYFNLSKAREVKNKGLFGLFPKSFYDNNNSNGESINVFESPNISNNDFDFFQSAYMSDTGGSHLERVPIKCPSTAEKCEKALKEIEKIQKLDPDMNYYYGSTYGSGEDGNGEDSATHLVVRFGYNGFNNVIAIPVDNKPRAMFCWRGKTNEDREGWRKYFQGSSRERDAAVQRFICHGYSSKGVQALDQQWRRVWEYLNHPDN